MSSGPTTTTTSPSLIDTLFQRTLEDLIKSLRSNLTTESKSLEEIHREIKSTDLSTKSTALQKLNYLNALYGHDMSWASFHAIEVISSPTFPIKRIGYVAITQSFNNHTPVMLLITNQLRKDLNSTNQYEVSLALDCVVRIANVDLARDLSNDVFTILCSSCTKVYVKKKAVAVLLRVFDVYPDAVKVCFKKLVDCLECDDEEPVVSAVIGVFCELTIKDARSYLPLAPEFYKILVGSRNNWVLIKVLKIFAKLAPLEPRLANRVVEPICEHIRRTGAKSLLFECIRTVVSSFSEHESAIKLAVSKIKEFLVDDDPNLKYLGLSALSMVAPNHSWAVLDHKEFVIKSLSDVDPNIKVEALRLVMIMVSDNNVAEICRVLVNYALKSDPVFCNEILGSILSTCSKNVYEVIVDFDWYVSLLGEMSRIPNCQQGEHIETQLIDIGMRVKDVRPQLVQVGRDLLIDPALLGNHFLHRILSAAAWVCGEYVEFVRNPFELVEALLQPRTSLLPPSILGIYVNSTLKILVNCLHSYLLQSRLSSEEPFDNKQIEGNENEIVCQTELDSIEDNNFKQETVLHLISIIELALGPLSGNHDVELQERARNVMGFIDLIKEQCSCNEFGRNDSL
ncbi:hypothetical protein ACFE04_010110 [Oxalis oulophora]